MHMVMNQIRVADKYIEYIRIWFSFDFWNKIGLIEEEHRILVCVIIIFYVFVGDSRLSCEHPFGDSICLVPEKYTK